MHTTDFTDSGHSTVRDTVAPRHPARRSAAHAPKDAAPTTAAWPGVEKGPRLETDASTSQIPKSGVRRNYLIAAAIAATAHLSVLFGFNGREERTHVATARPEETIITLEMPELEPPETVEVVEANEAPASPQLAPPMQMDLPSTVPISNFTETMRPMIDPSLTSVGAITIPSVTTATLGGAGGVRLFDLKELDRVPRRMRTVIPVYPHELRRAGIKGEVVLLVIIDVGGHVEVERVISATHREFEAAAVTAAEQCLFESPMRAGQRVNARYTWSIPFELW